MTKIKILHPPEGTWTGPPKITAALNPQGLAWNLSQATHVVRWGYTGKFPDDLNQQAKVLNKKSAIQRVSDKANARSILQAEGVKVPKSVFGIESYLRDPASFKDRPVIVRPNKHSQGSDFWRTDDPFTVYAKMQEFFPGGYIQEDLTEIVEDEYRVLVFQGRVLFMYRKKEFLSSSPGQHGIDTDITMINWSQMPKGVIRQAIRAVEVLGLDFAAVDVLVDRAGEEYVLECNTAPECGTMYRAQKFARAIQYWADGKTPEPAGFDHFQNYVHPSELNQE